MRRLQVERQHFVVEGAEVRAVAVHDRRRAGVRAGLDLVHLAAVGDADRPEDGVAAGDERQPVLDGRRRVHLALGQDLPAQLAGARVERVEVAVVGADEDDVVDDRPATT